MAIRNKNPEMVQLLIDGDEFLDNYRVSQVCNIGHVLSFLFEIINVEWEEGIPLLFGFKRVKQLFSCITNTDSFLHIIYELIELFFDSPNFQSGNEF